MPAKDYEELKWQVATWCNRAQMAQQQRSFDLTRQALDKCWVYQRAIAKAAMKPDPERPETPQEVLDWLRYSDLGFQGKGPDLPRDPYQPSRVPLRPLPVSGAGAIALPLPIDPEDEQ